MAYAFGAVPLSKSAAAQTPANPSLGAAFRRCILITVLLGLIGAGEDKDANHFKARREATPDLPPPPDFFRGSMARPFSGPVAVRFRVDSAPS